MGWWHQNHWIQQLSKLFQRYYLPLLLGVIGTIAVLGIWQHSLEHEQLNTHALVQQEASAIEVELSQKLSTRILALEQMARRWQITGGTPKAAWEADAVQYVEDFGGYQAIEWVDPSFHVRWVIPGEGNEAVQNLDLGQESRRQMTLSIARDLHQTLLTRTVTLAQGGKGMLAVVPLLLKDGSSTRTIDHFDGFILGVFRFQSLFDSILKTSPQYQIQIFDHNGLIYSQGTPSTTMQPGIGVVQTYGADWQIQVFPTSEFVAAGLSLLPGVILWGGLATVWTLALTVSLKQKATWQVQQIRRINRQLQDESIYRQQIEARLQQLVSHMNVGFVVHAPDTHILQCNTAACELLGLSMDQMFGRAEIDPAWHFIREDGTLMSVEEFPINLVLSTQLALDKYVLGIDRGSQSRVWVLVTAFPEFDANQQIKQVVVTFIDISQLKQAERNLREMTAAMENAISGISRLDTQGRYLYVNRAYAEMTGYQLEEMVGMDWQQTVHPDDLEFVRKAYQRMLQDGKVEVEAKGIRKDGSVFYKQLVIITTYDEQQQFVGHYCFLKDISDRKQAEANLLHQKEMFQTIVDHIPVMIALFDSHGQIGFVNPELEQVLGWSLEDWQHQDVLALCYPDVVYRQGVKEFMLAATGRWQDTVTLTASGQPLETSWANIRLSSGQFLGIGQDISDRKHKEAALNQAMEAAEAANLAKSVFLANMSHELRTPLNVILGFAQVMAHDASLTPTQHEDLQTIKRSGDYLLSLINDVLDLSKIEAGHASLEESGFDLISLLHTLRTMMAEQAQAKQLSLTFDIAPEVPQFVIADEQKLRQVLLNLLSNAIKFTSQGSVTLRVSVNDQQGRGENASENKVLPLHFCPPTAQSSNPIDLQCDVIDTGVGIAENEQQTIFDAFVQAEVGRKSVSGTGLGLTISRKLLELMHGTISVHSVPHVGSTFTVNIPVCPTSGINVQVQQNDRTIIGLLPEQPLHRILVVDDQRENRLLMVRLLTQLGLEVREAINGQEAIQIWQEWQPDLTWMDIRMPGMDGYETTQQIRAMEQEEASIIIALTAQASQSDRALALAAGCNDYISKPFREETLFLKLQEYLGLEYLYADPETTSSAPLVQSSGTNAEDLASFEPSVLAQLTPDWLEALEDLAICGNDRAIVNLTAQLSPKFDALRMHVINLANRYEFEQIVQLIHRGSSP